MLFETFRDLCVVPKQIKVLLELEKQKKKLFSTHNIILTSMRRRQTFCMLCCVDVETT